MAAHGKAAPGAAERVELIDEDDRRSPLSSLLKQVADTRRPNAYEHLDELGAVDREERHAGLARHGTREERLARARRSHQQHAFGNVAAKPAVALRIAQEAHDFAQLILGFV